MTSGVLLAGAAAAVAVADLMTKHLIFRMMEGAGRRTLIQGFLALTPSLNQGGVWGIGQGHVWLFVTFSIVAVGVILWIFLSLESPRTSLVLALGGVLGGAIGNLWDRLIHKGVRDFLDFHVGSRHWPTFNVADIFICLGAAVLVWQTWRTPDARAKAGGDATPGAASP